MLLKNKILMMNIIENLTVKLTDRLMARWNDLNNGNTRRFLVWESIKVLV